MDFANYNDYAVLTNTNIPLNKIKYFQVHTLNLDTSICMNKFKIQYLTGFTLKYNCSLLKSVAINKGKNLDGDILLGCINTLKIHLREFIEYDLLDNIEMIFNEDFIGASITTEMPIKSSDKINLFFNYIHLSSNSNNFLNLSMVYTIYIV